MNKTSKTSKTNVDSNNDEKILLKNALITIYLKYFFDKKMNKDEGLHLSTFYAEIMNFKRFKDKLNFDIDEDKINNTIRAMLSGYDVGNQKSKWIFKKTHKEEDGYWIINSKYLNKKILDEFFADLKITPHPRREKVFKNKDAKQEDHTKAAKKKIKSVHKTLSKTTEGSSVKIDEVYGIGPVVKGYFNKNKIYVIGDLRQVSESDDNLKDLINNIPGMLYETYQEKNLKFHNFLDETKKVGLKKTTSK